MNEFYFAQKAFIISEGKLLLVRKSDDDPNQAGKWEVPGGRMAFGEEIDEHLKREVREEVGLDVCPGRPFYVWQWRIQRPGEKGEIRDMQIVAVARICDPLSTEFSTEKRVADDFLAEIAWVPFDDIKKYNVIANMNPVIDAFLALPEINA